MFRLKINNMDMHYLGYETAHLHNLAGVFTQKLGQVGHPHMYKRVRDYASYSRHNDAQPTSALHVLNQLTAGPGL